MNSHLTFSWRSILLPLLILALALGLTGCSSKGNSDKKTFVLATASDVVIMDPQMINDIPSTNVLLGKVYENLVTVDAKGQLVPQLATEWKQVNPTTWEFTLRKGVKFQDGTPFNAEVIKKNFDRLRDPAVPKVRRQLLDKVQEVKVISDDKVQIITSTPFPPLLPNLAHTGTAIISGQAIDNDKTKPIAQNPVGTGPYKMALWTKGEQVTLEAFPDYWGKKPTLNKIIFKVVPEDATRMAMVQTGEAQAADKVPFTDVDRYAKDAKFNLIRTVGYGTEFIGLNLRKPQFEDIRVRQAINLAIDRDAILSGVYNNVGKKNVSTLGPLVFGFNPNLPAAEYNPEKAKQLLKEAGMDNGKLQFSIWTSSNNKVRIKLAEVLQAQLKSVGIQVDIKTVEWGAFLAAMKNGETDMYLLGWANQSGDGDASLSPVWSKEGFMTGENGSFYSTPQVEELLVAARQEMNPEKRKEMYQKVQEIFTADQVRFVTRGTEYISITGKNVKGLRYTPSEVSVFDDVVIE